MTVDPYSFLEDNLKEYKEKVELAKKVEEKLNFTSNTYKTNEALFIKYPKGSRQRSILLAHQQQLMIQIRDLKSELRDLHRYIDALQAYPKFRYFIDAAKRRLSVEDWHGAWEEVEQKLEQNH